eukprot:6484012-Prymnesium_polylepis.1
MPFEHHGEGAWSFRGHPQHLCGPSRFGRAGHQGGGRALGHGAIVCDPYFIHKHRWLITQTYIYLCATYHLSIVLRELGLFK